MASAMAKVYRNLVKRGTRQMTEIQPEDLREEVYQLLDEEGFWKENTPDWTPEKK